MTTNCTMLYTTSKLNAPSANICLVDTHYNTLFLSSQEVKRKINRNLLNVSNLDVCGDKLISVNGAEENYIPEYREERVVLTRPVILNRIETKNRLVGYTVMINLLPSKMTITEAVNYHKNTMRFANAKIMTTKTGEILSAIRTNFNICEIDIDSAKKTVTPKDQFRIKLGMVNLSRVGNKDTIFVGINVFCDNLAIIKSLKKKLCIDKKAYLPLVSIGDASCFMADEIHFRMLNANVCHIMTTQERFKTIIGRELKELPKEKSFVVYTSIRSGVDTTDEEISIFNSKGLRGSGISRSLLERLIKDLTRTKEG